MICRGQSSVDLYINSAKAHGDASANGDHKKANASYYEIVKCFKELRKARKLDELLDLLNHDNAAVRLWAATHSLESNERKAIVALRELAAADHLASFDAQMILDQWKKGEFIAPE